MFRSDFPLFSKYPDLCYLDSAATAQKPQKVIDALAQFLSFENANIHRGSYDLSMNASTAYDNSKKELAKLLGCTYHEIVYTYNATYAFNLIARNLIKSKLLKRGDVVLLSQLEHHANIVPWQIIAEEYGIKIEWVGITKEGGFDYLDFSKKVSHATVVSVTGASNVTGEVIDLAKIQVMISMVKNKPLFIVDGSQLFPHKATHVTNMHIDIFIGTGHKVMSDTGIGFIYVQKPILRSMLPSFCGGGAINSVTMEKYEPAGLPFRHEPGTPHIAGAVSLGAACEYIDSIGGYEAIEAYEQELVDYALEKCQNLPAGIRLIGSMQSKNRIGVFSFMSEKLHPVDLAEELAMRNICVRVGHHCVEPLHQSMKIEGSLRASFYIYTTKKDIDHFFNILAEVCAI